MSGTVWIPEAENLTASGTSGTMLGGPPRVVWHTTEAPSGNSSSGRQYFDLMHGVLVGKKAEPHILWDPVTDRMGQYFPLDRSARALRNDPDGGISTNKTGVVCIQIEVVAYASKPFTGYWKPGPNLRALMRTIRSWDIPDVWPGGRMSQRGEDVSRDLTTYKTRAGHYGHCHVPGNSHWDCGGIDQRALLAVTSTPEPVIDLRGPEMRMLRVKDNGRIYTATDTEVAYVADPAIASTAAAVWGEAEEVSQRQVDVLAYDANARRARQRAEVVAAVAKAIPGVNVDERALAAELAPAVIAALGEAKGLTAEDVEAALRSVLGSLDKAA